MVTLFSFLALVGFLTGTLYRILKSEGDAQRPKGYGKPDSEFFRLMRSARAGDPQSQYLLGMTFADGLGVRPDVERAAYWYQKAAEQNHAAAQYNLGVLYREGRGMARDEGRAKELFAMAAEKGYSPSLESLSNQDSKGEDIE